MLRTLSSRAEQGNAIHTVECNTEAVFKIVGPDAVKTMRDAVLIMGKRAAIWVNEVSNSDDSLDLRFASMSNSIISGEQWTAHRLVCVPRSPGPDTDEYSMLEDFFKSMYREAQWSGVAADKFEEYLKHEQII